MTDAAGKFPTSGDRVTALAETPAVRGVLITAAAVVRNCTVFVMVASAANESDAPARVIALAVNVAERPARSTASVLNDRPSVLVIAAFDCQ